MKYWLHFLGRGLYPKRSFFAEAKQIGVNRAIPRTALKKLKWGDKVLIAYGGRETAKADIVGYFVTTGINMNCSTELKEKLLGRLNVIQTAGGCSFTRRCGSYDITSSHTVTDTIEELVSKGEELEKEAGEKIKWFMAGKFYNINPEVLLEPVLFNRSVTEVEIPHSIDLEQRVDTSESTVGFMANYTRKSRYSKRKGEWI